MSFKSVWVIHLLRHRQSSAASLGMWPEKCSDITVRRQVHGDGEINSHTSKHPLMALKPITDQGQRPAGCLTAWLTAGRGWRYVKCGRTAYSTYLRAMYSAYCDCETPDGKWWSETELAHCPPIRSLLSVIVSRLPLQLLSLFQLFQMQNFRTWLWSFFGKCWLF